MNFDNLIEKLEEATTFTKDCTVGSMTLTVRVLNFKEEQKLSRLIDSLTEESEDDFSIMNDWKKYVVAMAIHKIDGTVLPASMPRGEELIERSLFMKDVLDNLPSKITDIVFDVYTDLKEESEKDIEKNLEYNWFKDPEIRSQEISDKVAKDREKEAKILNGKEYTDDVDGNKGVSDEDGEPEDIKLKKISS